MFNKERIYLVFFCLLLLLWLLPGSLMVIKNGRPYYGDSDYHLRLIDGWLNGENPLINEEYFLIGAPYPPAFHWTMAIFSYFTSLSSLTIMNILQIILFPSILISFLYLAQRETNLYAGVLGVSFLLSGLAFYDRGGQVIPQAVDLLLFPIVVYSFLENKRIFFIILCTYLIYNHGIFPFLLISSLLFYSLLYDSNRLKEFGVVLVLSLPLFIVISKTREVSKPIIFRIFELTSPQHELFVLHPLYGVMYLGYFFALFTLIGIFYFYKKEKNEFEKILIFWIIFLIPLNISLPDRFMSYASQPFALISAITIDELLKNEKNKIYFLALMLSIALFYFFIWLLLLGFLQWPFIESIKRILVDSYSIIG